MIIEPLNWHSHLIRRKFELIIGLIEQLSLEHFVIEPTNCYFIITNWKFGISVKKFKQKQPKLIVKQIVLVLIMLLISYLKQSKKRLEIVNCSILVIWPKDQHSQIVIVVLLSSMR